MNDLPRTSNSPAALPRLKCRLRRAAELAVRRGHPWVFAESIQEQNREAQTGEITVIYDARNAFLAVGLYDPHSPIRIRILHAGKPQTVNPEFFRQSLAKAMARRCGLADERTTGLRWIHGESDGWPGLVLDQYADTLVLKIYSAVWLPRLKEVAALFCDQLGPASLILRLSRNLQISARDIWGIQEGRWWGEDRNRVIFQEDGLNFSADVLHGQKTGFFLDQRENRRRVGEMAAGRTVLNAFSFSGGFSLHAARGGAQSVTDLDISRHALEAARENLALNAADPLIASAKHESVAADAFTWLADNPARRFDLIILDPPSLAKREAERERAIPAYERLSLTALARLNPGGILVSASCSAHVSRDEFFLSVRRAAAQSGRRWRERWTSGHAPDHPATFPEAEYLKCLCLEVS